MNETNPENKTSIFNGAQATLERIGFNLTAIMESKLNQKLDIYIISLSNLLNEIVSAVDLEQEVFHKYNTKILDQLDTFTKTREDDKVSLNNIFVATNKIEVDLRDICRRKGLTMKHRPNNTNMVMK